MLRVACDTRLDRGRSGGLYLWLLRFLPAQVADVDGGFVGGGARYEGVQVAAVFDLPHPVLVEGLCGEKWRVDP